jgi:hypothetical protein
LGSCATSASRYWLIRFSMHARLQLRGIGPMDASIRERNAVLTWGHKTFKKIIVFFSTDRPLMVGIGPLSPLKVS